MKNEADDLLFDGSLPLPSNSRAHRQLVHNRLLQIYHQSPGCRLLEIGVGPMFRLERFKTIDELGIHYVGLDFEHVCSECRADLTSAHIANRKIRFWGNRVGTYLFNLIRLARHRETFDIIYLDGNHSIYVDLPAAVAAVRLLKPGGLFLFDDVRFCFGSTDLIECTLQHAETQEAKNLTEDEANEPHVRIIIREYLIPLFGFEVAHSWSNPDWIALRAPAVAPWMAT
ncbi:SAM-dependent methyltransferase [Bradyrhizobium sp. i1.4.4]